MEPSQPAGVSVTGWKFELTAEREEAYLFHGTIKVATPATNPTEASGEFPVPLLPVWC